MSSTQAGIGCSRCTSSSSFQTAWPAYVSLSLFKLIHKWLIFLIWSTWTAGSLPSKLLLFPELRKLKLPQARRHVSPHHPPPPNLLPAFGKQVRGRVDAIIAITRKILPLWLLPPPHYSVKQQVSCSSLTPVQLPLSCQARWWNCTHKTVQHCTLPKPVKRYAAA